MAQSKSYVDRQKEEMERYIDEALQMTTKQDDIAKSSVKRSLFYEQRVSQELIKSYDEREKTSFQGELKDLITPMTIEKISLALDGKEEKQQDEKERKQEETKKVQEVEEQGIEVDNATRKKAEKSVATGEEVDLQAAVLKSVYQTVMEEYYQLKNDLQTGPNGQTKTGDLSVPDKLSTKLVLYENYLRKVDMQYKSHTGAFIAADDKDIGKAESKYALRDEKNERAVYERANDNFDRIQTLHQELDSIAESIVYLAGMSDKMDPVSFKAQMDALQKQYVDKGVELSRIEPNPVEFNRQLAQREEEETYRTRTVGTEYERQRSKSGAITTKVKDLDAQNDLTKDQLKEEVQDTRQEISAESQTKAQDLLQEFYHQLEVGNMQKAEEILQSAEAIAGIQIVEMERSEQQSFNDNQQKGSKTYEKPLDEELDKATESQENVTKKDVLRLRAKDVQDKIGEIEHHTRKISGPSID